MAAGIRKEGESLAQYRARLDREQAQMYLAAEGTRMKGTGARIVSSNGHDGIVVDNRAGRRAQYVIARRRGRG